MKLQISIFIIYLWWTPPVIAQQICENHGTAHTPKGNLIDNYCHDLSKNSPSLDRYTLNESILFSSPYPTSFTDENKEKTLFVIQGPYDNDLACPSRMFLIDLTGDKPHVYAFGVKNACAEYHWASWGKMRSVIAIKENIRFTYSNGKLTPPPADFGDGTPVNIRPPADPRSWPFVEEIPIK